MPKFVLSIRRSVSGKLCDRNLTDEVQIDDPLAAVHFATLGTLFRHTDSFCSEINRGWDCATDLAMVRTLGNDLVP